MADIRSMTEDDAINRIIFADYDATHIDVCAEYTYGFRICDSTGDYVVIHSKQHAENLIKAINKAIHLGFVK